MDWKSSGDTNFAPIASAQGEMEYGGFWDHGKPDVVWRLRYKLSLRDVAEMFLARVRHVSGERVLR